MKYAPALGLLVLVLGSLALVVMPSYLVSPVRAQTAGDIALSHTLAGVATPVAMVNLVVGALLALSIWRRPESKLRSKIAVAFAVVVLAFATMNTRGYVVETMFEALPEVVRLPGYDAQHVDADELVLGVTLAGESAAYPLPIIAYHHIVNDRLGDEPFVVTY